MAKGKGSTRTGRHSAPTPGSSTGATATSSTTPPSTVQAPASHTPGASTSATSHPASIVTPPSGSTPGTYRASRSASQKVWRTQEGHEKIRKLAKDRGVKFLLRDFQIENVARILDGIDVFLVTATGDGKSMLITVPLVVTDDHISVIVEPTKELQYDMVCVDIVALRMS